MLDLIIPLNPLSSKTWLLTPNCLSMRNIKNTLAPFQGYSNSQLMGMAAILDKTSSTGIFRTFYQGYNWAPEKLFWKFKLSRFFSRLNPNAPGLNQVIRENGRLQDNNVGENIRARKLLAKIASFSNGKIYNGCKSWLSFEVFQCN